MGAPTLVQSDETWLIFAYQALSKQKEDLGMRQNIHMSPQIAGQLEAAK